MISPQTKKLLIIGVILLLAVIWYRNYQSSLIKNSGSVNLEDPQNMSDANRMVGDESQYLESRDYAPPESDWLKGKFDGRNKATGSDYKRSSYDGAMRGNLGPSDWDKYFDHNNNVISNSQSGDNDNFLPNSDGDKEFAVFKSNGRATCGSNQKCDPEDLFDVDKMLPQQVTNDWFDVVPEPISLKSRNLINISKPVGVNTIGGSNKIANYDLRAQPVNPKFVVSPWLGSSVEPQLSTKPLC